MRGAMTGPPGGHRHTTPDLARLPESITAPEELAEKAVEEELALQQAQAPEESAGEKVQDNVRERRLRELFGLVKPRGAGRSGTDAELLLPGGKTVPFELKS